MMKYYYIVRMRGKQQFWLAGPYLHKDQAEMHKSELLNIDCDGCPDEFITQRKFDCGDGFIRIAVSCDKKQTWYGDNTIELIPKNII